MAHFGVCMVPSTTHTLWHGNVSSEMWQRNFLKGLKFKGWFTFGKKILNFWSRGLLLLFEYFSFYAWFFFLFCYGRLCLEKAFERKMLLDPFLLLISSMLTPCLFQSNLRVFQQSALREDDQPTTVVARGDIVMSRCNRLSKYDKACWSLECASNINTLVISIPWSEDNFD